MVTSFLLSFFACLPEIKSTEEERFIENPGFDYDQDGYTEDQGDCDDQNPNVNPNHQEICDDLDNDCNGEIDDQAIDIQTFYQDQDGDGFGVEAISETVCLQNKTDGYIEVKIRDDQPIFDCDDTNDNIHPDAQEICDLQDNNCSGEIDDYSGLDAPVWYLDDDSDGFGDFDRKLNFCPDENGNGPDNYVDNFGDCDDSNADVYPNADEYCNEIDDNCNGLTDEALSKDALIWYADRDGDGFGAINDFQPDCLDPQDETEPLNISDEVDFILNNTDCNDSDSSVNPAAEELCDTVDNDCDGLLNEGQDSTAPANASTFYQDLDADGYGNPNATQIQCSQPTDFVTDSTDCDDSNGVVYPSADEYCNEIDDDCDGQTDEGQDSTAPINAPTYYADSDSDGFGDAGTTLVQCSLIAGYVVDNTDCDDGSSSLNRLDTDEDGFTTCDGDCDDSDASLNLSDSDNDGFSTCDEDCDDSSVSVYPNATEYCNGTDDDCDGQTDEEDAIDKSSYYEDLDGDGYGNSGSSLYLCPLTQLNDYPDYVSNDSDCDDSDASQYPGAEEYCNTEDDDCNGTIDENYAIDTSTFYADLDGDGYGNIASTVQSCSNPAGYLVDNTDCDDSSALVRPSASEFCNNIDDDCNGDVDDLAVDATTYYVDTDGDGHGLLVDTVNGYDRISCPSFDVQTGLPITPVGFSELNDDCDDAESGISPSADELCTDTIDENCDGSTTGGAVDFSTYIIDADNDGFGSGARDEVSNELIYTLDLCTQPVGYILYDETIGLDCDDGDDETKPGAVERCNGKIDDCPLDGDNTVPLDEWDDDGDGYVECTIESSFLYNSDGTVNGWENPNQIIFGGDDCEDDDEFTYPNALELCNGVYDNCSNPNYSIVGAPDNESDDDGDGYVECEYNAQIWEGDVSVQDGGDCNDTLANHYPRIHPDTQLLSCFGDTDGDGYPDQSWGFCSSIQNLAQAEYVFIGENSSDYAGYSISSAGDIDGDGLDDILIGAYRNDAGGSNAGKSYLFLGSSLGSISEIDLSLADYSFIGENVDDRSGYSISSAGDVDGDGLDDILIGAVGNDDGGSNAGKVALFSACE